MKENKGMKTLVIILLVAVVFLAAVLVFLFVTQEHNSRHVVKAQATADSALVVNQELQAKVANLEAKLAKRDSERSVLAKRIDSLETERVELAQRVKELETRLSIAGRPVTVENTPVSGTGVAVDTTLSTGQQIFFYRSGLGDLAAVRELPASISPADSVAPYAIVSGGDEAWIKDPQLALARGRDFIAKLRALGLQKIGPLHYLRGAKGVHGVGLVKIKKLKPEIISARVPESPSRLVQSTPQTHLEPVLKNSGILGFDQVKFGVGFTSWLAHSSDISSPAVSIRFDRGRNISVYLTGGRNFNKADQLGSRYDFMAALGLEYLPLNMMSFQIGPVVQYAWNQNIFDKGKFDGRWAEDASDFYVGFSMRRGRITGRLLYGRPEYTLAIDKFGKRVNSIFLAGIIYF